MNDENGNNESDRNIEFILATMARLTTRHEELAIRHEAMAAQQQRTDEIVSRLAQATLNRLENVEAKTDALIDAQIKTEEAAQEQRASVKVLIDAQIKTEDGMQELRDSMKALTEAHIKTEEQIQQLAEGQRISLLALERLIGRDSEQSSS